MWVSTSPVSLLYRERRVSIVKTQGAKNSSPQQYPLAPLVRYLLRLSALFVVPFACLGGCVFVCVALGYTDSDVAWSAIAFVGKFLLFALMLILSCFIHELGHYLSVRYTPSISGFTWEMTWTRISLVCEGKTTPQDRIIGGLAGPGLSLICGTLLCLFPGTRTYGIIFCLHAIFLLPIFGDGKQILIGLIQLIPTKLGNRPK